MSHILCSIPQDLSTEKKGSTLQDRCIQKTVVEDDGRVELSVESGPGAE